MRGQHYDCAAVIAVLTGDQLLGLVTIERLLAAPTTAVVSQLMDSQPPIVASTTV
ncbi:hypothetical protein [Arthrobacter sp. CAN_A212]